MNEGATRLLYDASNWPEKLEIYADDETKTLVATLADGVCTGIYEGMTAAVVDNRDSFIVRLDAAGCPAFHATVRIVKTCCFCKGDVGSYGGNSPHPANKTDGARCCDGCNMKVVIPARLANYCSS